MKTSIAGVRASLVRALAAASAGHDVLWAGTDVGAAMREAAGSPLVLRLNMTSRHISVRGGGTIRFDRAEDPMRFAGLELQAVEYDTAPPDDVLAAIESRIRPKRPPALRARAESVFRPRPLWLTDANWKAALAGMDAANIAEAFRRGWQAWGGPTRAVFTWAT